MSDTPIVRRTLDLTAREFTEAWTFITSASKADGTAIGFLPYQAVLTRHEQGNVRVVHRNGDLLGFVLTGVNHWRECRVLQIWVRADARMIEHGRALISSVIREVAEPQRAWELRLWCASDLAANLFWKSLGFHYSGWRWNRKNVRKHFLWRLRPLHPAWQSLAQASSPRAVARDVPNPRTARPQLSGAAQKEQR